MGLHINVIHIYFSNFSLWTIQTKSHTVNGVAPKLWQVKVRAGTLSVGNAWKGSGICTDLDLREGDLKAKALIEVRIQSVLFDWGLLLLKSLPVVLQHHFDKWVWDGGIKSDIGSEASSLKKKINCHQWADYFSHKCWPDSPPTSIFFKFLASMMLTVSFPAVGT